MVGRSVFEAAALDAMKKDVENDVFEFSLATGKDGSVFDSVHGEAIVEKLYEYIKSHNAGTEFSPDMIHIDIKPIKELGEHTIEAKIKPAGVNARTWQIKIAIAPSE